MAWGFIALFVYYVVKKFGCYYPVAANRLRPESGVFPVVINRTLTRRMLPSFDLSL